MSKKIKCVQGQKRDCLGCEVAKDCVEYVEPVKNKRNEEFVNMYYI